MPQMVHLTPTTSAMPDLLARQIDAMVKETAKVVSKEGAANANHYEVEQQDFDLVAVCALHGDHVGGLPDQSINLAREQVRYR